MDKTIEALTDIKSAKGKIVELSDGSISAELEIKAGGETIDISLPAFNLIYAGMVRLWPVIKPLKVEMIERQREAIVQKRQADKDAAALVKAETRAKKEEERAQVREARETEKAERAQERTEAKAKREKEQADNKAKREKEAKAKAEAKIVAQANAKAKREKEAKAKADAKVKREKEAKADAKVGKTKAKAGKSKPKNGKVNGSDDVPN